MNNRYLIDYDGRRDNNFTALRLLFAWAVLYGHSFAIQKVPGISDPLGRIFKQSIWIGEIAVNGFFVISGFLVAASFIRRGVIDYSISRVLRIYPALVVCVFATVFLLGPWMTSLSLRDYFSHPLTWDHLSNALAFDKMHFTLPGLFENNARDAVNGSLWTLTVEVRCYLVLAVVGMFGVLRERMIANLFLCGLLLFGMFFYADLPLFGWNPRWARPASYFIIGVLLYINRDRIPLDGRLALFAALLAWSSFGKEWFDYVFAPSLSYLIFCVAYALPRLNLDDSLGDISYGMYIYAWPVQQVVASYFTSIGPYKATLISAAIVTVLAWLSWHYLEKPALGLKGRLLRRSG